MPSQESFFDICASPGICFKGTCCTGCLFGQNVARLTNKSCVSYCCGYTSLLVICSCGLLHRSFRAKLREKYGLQEQPTDLVAGCLLSPIGVCQEAREIDSREKSPSTKVQRAEPKRSNISDVESEVSSVAESTGD